MLLHAMMIRLVSQGKKSKIISLTSIAEKGKRHVNSSDNFVVSVVEPECQKL